MSQKSQKERTQPGIEWECHTTEILQKKKQKKQKKVALKTIRSKLGQDLIMKTYLALLPLGGRNHKKWKKNIFLKYK